MERDPGQFGGEFRDGINVGMIVAGVAIGSFFFAIDVGSGAFKNPFLGVFASLFPLLCLAFASQGFVVASVAFDRYGWRYQREIFGRPLEAESGQWSDVGQTWFRQWVRQGRNGVAVFGEFSLWDKAGKLLIKALTTFYRSGGAPGASHAPWRREFGLDANDFARFVRLVNDETPQLPYLWAELPLTDEDSRPHGFFTKRALDHYAQVARRSPG